MCLKILNPPENACCNKNCECDNPKNNNPNWLGIALVILVLIGIVVLVARS